MKNDMSMSRSTIGKAVLAAAAVAAFAAAFLYLVPFRVPARLSGVRLPEAVALPYPAGADYRQTGNNCGPYAAAAAVRALEGRDALASEQAVAQMPLRVPGWITMPEGERMFLERRGYAAESDDASGLDETGRVRFLREKLAAGNVLILLVGRSLVTQHYLTVLGYDRPRDVFFVYNSALPEGEPGMTVDANGAEPGNITMSADDLLKYWSGGGVLGFYRWTALAAHVR